MSKKLDLAEILGLPAKQDERIFSRPVANFHEFYLSGEIEGPENYIEWFQTIRHAGPSDIFKMYINSPGGDISAAIQFMRVIQESQATFIVSVEGICASAATMIFLMADNFEVSDYSMFMFHTYSGGVVGKGGEMWDQLKHERKWSEHMLKDIYKDFLTEKEIMSLLENKDIWMDGQEVVKRLKKRESKRKQAETAPKVENKPK
jgi:ATP-dependent protease ClpP protease subunit